MKFSEKTFRKIFIFLITLSLGLIFILGMNLLLFVPINSKPLWIGSLLLFLSINLLHGISSKLGKVIILAISIILMTTYFTMMLNWSLTPSLYVAAIGISLVALLYMTFV